MNMRARQCTISLVKIRVKVELLDEIGPSMDRHAKLVQYVHQVRYKILEGHGKTISWRNELVRVQKRGFGPMISLLVINRDGAREKYHYIAS